MRQAGVPADVRRLQERFARWRTKKKVPAEPIPPKLWEAAVKHCASHGVSLVSHWLRLHYATLQKRVDKRSAPRSRQSQPNFVEWRLPDGSLPGVSSAEYVVEVPGQGDVAQRVHVRGASVLEVAALARALRAAGNAG